MQADIGLWLENGAHLIDDLQQRPGQLVGDIFAVPAYAGEVKKLSVAGGDSLVAGGDHGIIGIIAMEPEAFENFFAKLPIHPRRQGALVVGEQVLVKAPKGDAGAGVVFIAQDQHMGEPEGLKRLPKILGRFPGDQKQIVSYGFQFRPALLVGLCL